MLASGQIVRFIEGKDYRRLVERLLLNGRCHSQVVQQVLRHPDALEPTAVGLGLQRIIELSYWPLPEGAELAHRLVRLQRRDGLTGCASAEIEHLIAPTAIAVRAVCDWLTEYSHDDAKYGLLQQFVDRACLALREAFEREVIGGEPAHNASWAIVLWQLGDCDSAVARLPLTRIHERVLAAGVAMPDFRADDLARLALTMAA